MCARLAMTAWIGVTLAFVATCAAQEPWELRSDTWVATDALGRHLPLHDEVGAARTRHD